MRQIIFIATIIFTLMMAGCDQANISPAEQTSTQISLTKTASPEPIPTKTFAPTETPAPTNTPAPSPLPTSTPPPTHTPTARVTPAPVAISPANASGLQRDALYTLPIRDKLQQAEWSQNSQLVLVTTNTGTDLLAGSSLEQKHFLPGTYPITELEDDQWLVSSGGQLQNLVLEADDYQLLPGDTITDGSGLRLVSRNGEIGVRTVSEDEIEVVALKTDTRRTFNIREAGYQLNYMRPTTISADGKMLIIEDTYWSNLYFVNLESFDVVYVRNSIYEAPIFSTDGQYILLTDNGGIKVLKAKNGIQVNRFSDGFIVRPTSQSYIYYGAVTYDFLPDGQRVGVVYCVREQKCELYIWSMLTGQPETIVKGLPLGVDGLDFMPNGDGFLIVSRDGTVSTWSLESQAMLAESQPYDRANPVVSPDGSLTAIPRGSQIEIFDVATGELWMKLGDYQGMIGLMVDSITEKYLLVAGYDHSSGAFSDLWDLSSGERVRQLRPHDYPNIYANEAYCTHDSQANMIACGASPLQVFEVKTGALLYSNKSQDGSLIGAISPNGNTLATCTVTYTADTHEPIPDDLIYFLDLSTSTSVIAAVLESPNGGICSPMVFSPDSQYLATQSGYIWDLSQLQLQASFSMMDDAPLAFNPDGSLLISGNRVIHTDTGEILVELDIEVQVKTIGFDPDGFHLMLNTYQGVEIWSVSGE